MGIPKYFRWITNKYDDLIYEKIEVDVDNLLLDSNCLIHPCCRKILSSNQDLIDIHNKNYKNNVNNIENNINITSKLEKLMFKEIINYI